MRCIRLCTTLSSIIYIAAFLFSCKIVLHEEKKKSAEELRAEDLYNRTHPDDERDLPLIFVGGVPRSGTTLMRTMLEAHEDIRCGPETHVIPYILSGRTDWMRYEKETLRLEKAGVEPDALNIAMANFILEIIKYHAPPALYYCNKDPLVLTHMTYMKGLFPNSKYIFMIRDGRGAAHSIVSRNVRITNVNIKSYRSVLKYWNGITETCHRQCLEIGESNCLPVHYEQLVLQPINTTKQIFEFLDIKWHPDVLHHEKHVRDTKLSKFECSSNQVNKPLYMDALTRWFGKIPKDVEKDMPKIAPMLAKLGYDPYNSRPSYGEPDDFVLGKSKYE